MLSAENNERLTRVGPGTPMGRLMREYWIPALLSAELAAPDCAPVRVMLLGERLVAFRDSNGRPGLISEACPHRGASLFLGRNSKCGLRCAYHGWKFDVNGACLETPTEPPGSRLGHKVKTRAYPCVERGGLVWTYMGTRATLPPLPDLEANLDPHHRAVDAAIVPSNWLQNLEGDVDVAHVPWVHTDNIDPFAKVLGLPRGAAAAAGAATDADAHEDAPEPWFPAPHVEVADTPAGFAFASRAAASGEAGPEAEEWWSVGHYMFPFYANLPYSGLGSYWVVARVPMDDYHTMTFGLWKRGAPRSDHALMFGPAPAFVPNTSDWFGRFRLTRDVGNDFGLDRELARAGGIGIPGQAVQDAAITASMGPIVDRSREHLGKADIPISHLRRRLLAALNGLDVTEAPAVCNPAAYRVKHGAIRVRAGASWFEELRRRGGAGPIERVQPAPAHSSGEAQASSAR